jgi:hypothetical protein
VHVLEGGQVVVQVVGYLLGDREVEGRGADPRGGGVEPVDTFVDAGAVLGFRGGREQALQAQRDAGQLARQLLCQLGVDGVVFGVPQVTFGREVVEVHRESGLAGEPGQQARVCGGEGGRADDAADGQGAHDRVVHGDRHDDRAGPGGEVGRVGGARRQQGRRRQRDPAHRPAAHVHHPPDETTRHHTDDGLHLEPTGRDDEGERPEVRCRGVPRATHDEVQQVIAMAGHPVPGEFRGRGRPSSGSRRLFPEPGVCRPAPAAAPARDTSSCSSAASNRPAALSATYSVPGARSRVRIGTPRKPCMTGWWRGNAVNAGCPRTSSSRTGVSSRTASPTTPCPPGNCAIRSTVLKSMPEWTNSPGRPSASPNHAAA